MQRNGSLGCRIPWQHESMWWCLLATIIVCVKAASLYVNYTHAMLRKARLMFTAEHVQAHLPDVADLAG